MLRYVAYVLLAVGAACGLIYMPAVFMPSHGDVGQGWSDAGAVLALLLLGASAVLLAVDRRRS